MTEPTKHTFSGHVSWYLDGKLHREDGPAVVYSNGTKVWYIHGEHHREDGPAIEYANGGVYWFLFDQEFTKEKFKQITYSD